MPDKTGLLEFKKLLAAGGLPELGPGPRPGVLSQSALTKMLDELLARAPLPSVSRDLVRALILLWHDHLDAAHQIAQGIENSDGSFVHGIMHRREPDYGNAAYWFRLTGPHDSLPAIGDRAGEFLAAHNEIPLQRNLTPKGKWDPFAFIHACEKAAAIPPTDSRAVTLRQIQAIESEVLLEHFLKS